jgi:phosphoribosyl 1,2-cyclic phosphodiesterase
MKFYSLSSGSSGNSTLIEDNNHYILIDVGITYKELTSKLDELQININQIEAVLITHNHIDHVRSIKFFDDNIRYGIGGYFSLPAKNYLNPYNTYKFNDLEVFVLPASHDIDTINFVIKNKEETLVYITDTGYIAKKNLEYLVNADYYFFESNHDVKMLMESNRPIFLKKRILSDDGHLSNETASEYLMSLIGDKTKEIMFIHLSDVANTKDVCINTFNNIAIKRNKNISKLLISCAERHSISKGGKRD